MVTLVSRVKNLLQSNKQIGKIDSSVPQILSNSIEFFLIDLLNSSFSLIRKLGKKKLKTRHIKYVLMKKMRFENISQQKKKKN